MALIMELKARETSILTSEKLNIRDIRENTRFNFELKHFLHLGKPTE
jgi:hypothetical protein